MSVLVTGGGGFVGSHLVEALDERGERVCCLLHEDREEFPVSGSHIEFVEGDIRDGEFINGLVANHDEIYHVAALQNYLDPSMEEFMAVNVRGTENLMKAALETGADKVVYTSSQVTIDEHTQDRIDERFRHSDRFNTPYSLTKYKGEKVAFEYGARGLDVTTVHPTLIYGPRETHNLLGLIRTYIESPVRFKGFVDAVFNFVYVGDVVEGHIGAMEHGHPGERYLLGGEGHRLGEFLELIDELTNTQKPSITVPKSLVRLGVHGLNPLLEPVGLSFPLSKGQLYAMEYDSRIDNSKAKMALDFTVTPLREGLKETLEWYRQAGLISCDPIPPPVGREVAEESERREMQGPKIRRQT